MTLVGIGFGALLGVGVMCIVCALPSPRRDLRGRIAPYVRTHSAAAFDFLEARDSAAASPWRLGAVARRALDRFGPSTAELERLARRARVAGGAGRIRLDLGVSAIIGCGLGAVAALGSSAPTLVRLLLPVLGVVVGVWVRLTLLQRVARRRRAAIERELPSVLEFLCLAVASGESLPNALARVARIGAGEFTSELSEVCRQHELGRALGDVLAELDHTLDIPAVTRLSQQLRSALERGAPIVDVLQAHTADQRVRLKQAALEAAGRKEIAMMFPLVFLILPVTILFAVWPGFVALNAGFAR